MIRVVVVACVSLVLGCAGRVVRDAHVFDQEDRFYEASSLKLADQLLAKAAAKARGGDLAACAEFASDALVVRARTPWHVAKGRQLAGKGTDPGPPPPIPEPAAWCAEEAKKT